MLSPGLVRISIVLCDKVVDLLLVIGNLAVGLDQALDRRLSFLILVILLTKAWNLAISPACSRLWLSDTAVPLLVFGREELRLGRVARMFLLGSHLAALTRGGVPVVDGLSFCNPVLIRGPQFIHQPSVLRLLE